MKKKNCTILLIALCAIAAMMAGCGGSSSAPAAPSAPSASVENHELVIAITNSEASMHYYFCTRFKEYAETASKGSIKMTIYPNSQLGKTREMVEGNISGNIDIAVIPTALFTEFIPALGIFDMQVTFTDLTHARKVLDTPELLAALKVEFDKVGLKLFSFSDQGFRQITSNRPLQKLADFKNMKLRTMENASHIAFWTAMGCNPTPMDTSEMFISLQQKIIDGQENPIETIYDYKFYEVQKYLVMSNHLIFNLIAPFNKKRYDSMTSEQQKIMEDSIVRASKDLRVKTDEIIASRITFLKEKGMEAQELPLDVRKEMRSRATEADKLIRQKVGDQLVDLYLKIING